LTAAAVLQFSVLKNLYYSDRSFPEPGNIINKLVNIFREHHPDLVLCPHKDESDKEHQLVNKCCEEAVWLSKSKGYKSDGLLDINRSDTVTLFYEVWTPISVPSLFIDISDVIARKKEAIKAFSTQLACADWISGSIGLNAYRGTTLQGTGYCEAYLIEKTNIKHLKQIIDLIL
jgi:LmbE family N-acetylglucosaminyl deacetylase